MSIERDQSYDIVVECDCPGCPATFTISSKVDFNSGWVDAKRQGWRAKKVGGDWVHGCPRHAKEL